MNNEEKRQNPRGIDWGRGASVVICIAAAAFAVYIAIRYLLKYALPFIIAFLLASLVSAISGKLKRHTRLSRKTLSVSVLVLLLVSFTSIVYFSVRRLISELGRLTDGLSKGEGIIYEAIEKIRSTIESTSSRLSAMLPLIGNGDTESGAQKFNDIAEEVISSVISSISSALPGILSSIVSALPGLFLGLAVTIISAFYFTLDREKIKSTMAQLVPSSLRTRLPRIKNEAGRGAVKYLRAYSLIMLITFGEIFLGLSLLGVEYSFLIALITAVIDILPILGVGTLLIPWAVVSFLTNNYFLGVGLLILYGVIMVVRQIIEPKILGGSLGVHPLLTLAALYIGYRFAGFAGMLIAPLCLIAWRALHPSPNADAT